MKLSAKQAKLFLCRAQRRFKVSNDFIRRNIRPMLKFLRYALTPRIILKRKLIRKHNRVFLLHNYLRKLIFDPTKLKKRRHAKRLHLQWSKRLVLHLKRLSVVEFVEEEETDSKASLPEKDVSEQLKEQLELLKSGKRTVPLLEDSTIVKQRENSVNSMMLSSNDMAYKTHKTDLYKVAIESKVPLLTAVHITEDEFKSSSASATDKTIDKPNTTFLDMLISKVKHSVDESGGKETCLTLETCMDPPKQFNKVCEKETAETEERENSNSSSDFFGFEDNERVLGNFPGMLSTPLVRKCDSNSAFISETLNAYMRDNLLESSSAVNYPQRRPEDGQMLVKSVPPKLDMPALPEGLQGLRTVAERRNFLHKTKNTKYCIINNIATIFRELQKRMKGHRIYRQAIESIMTSSTVPMTRQGWKAAAWLLTEMGNFYCQTILVDGEHFRLCGGRGNYSKKFIKPHSSRSDKVLSTCSEECIDRITFRLLKPVRTPKKRSKLNDSSKNINKPCPLSQKILQHSRDEESVFGSLDIVRMPQVELEIFPQLQKPLSEVAKKYLAMILPYHEISREWAEFSVSTLLERQKMERTTDEVQSFTFKIPYANDRNHLIVRRIYTRSEKFEEDFKSSSFSFRKEIDQTNANGETFDLLALECADMLTDMLNSVAIGSSENSFIKDDPDNIYQYNGDEEIMIEKSVRKTDQLQTHAGMSNKKQSRLLMELKRLNATVIDAATSKSEEGWISCKKEYCKLGCVCASLSEGTTVRQHCGKQRCVLDCNCKCTSVLRLETDGRTITTEDAFMLRRQATAKLARVEKEFTSTVVLTGSETLLINESQYDKKRRCTKIPKRYGEFVDHDDPDFVDKISSKKAETPPTLNFPLEPVLVSDTIYNRLKHSSVRLKKLRDIKDVAPWCMVHMVYKCFCKGLATVGNPIIIEKYQEFSNKTTVEDSSSVVKNRSLYSFEKEECKANEGSLGTHGYEPYETTETSDATEAVCDLDFEIDGTQKIEKRGRITDNHYIELYMNVKANHCRRVVPIPKNIYKRRNKKRVAHIQLYIAENENDETRLSLNEHVLRSVYYHQDISGIKRASHTVVKKEERPKIEDMGLEINDHNRKDNANFKEKKSFNEEDNDKPKTPLKKRRMSMAQVDGGSSLLLVNHYKDLLKDDNITSGHSTSKSLKHESKTTTPKYIPAPAEQFTVPKISQIFSLNAGIVEMETTSPAPTSDPELESEPASAIDIAQPPSDEMASAHGVSTDAFKNVFKQVIKNMNNLVSKKMQDIDMALRRESKAIPAPNAEILCIIRWNNFLEAYLEGFVYLWEVRTANLTFIAATIKPIMPLVMNALSVVNIQALSRENLPLLGRMLIERKRSASSEGLAVVMQGQQMYWIVKGFLRPDKTRICPKPTPDSHPLLTRKINVLCRLLINNQFNEHKKRQDALQLTSSSNSSQLTVNSSIEKREQQPEEICSVNSCPETCTTDAKCSPFGSPSSIVQNDISLKLKVLPMQRNISDQATNVLEQMVSQAYGFVRTNISFRKIHSNELFEIFPPAKLNSNHHWLVLDISNDFSHIFVPELKDLLTLDRIQKVMAYALAKNRIVKMQFSQKSVFNAYVTPKSQRKLYFGPYRQNITVPKLVLLQSVDGQMMLREVYESRHSINPKTFSTTAFWVVQKSGKVFLDVEKEQVAQVRVYEHEMEEDNDVLLSEVQKNNITELSSEIQGRTQTYQNMQFPEDEQPPLKDSVQQNVQYHQGDQSQQHHQVPQSQVQQCKQNHKNLPTKQINQNQQDFSMQQSYESLQCRRKKQSAQIQEGSQIQQSSQNLECRQVQQSVQEVRNEIPQTNEMISKPEVQVMGGLSENLNVPILQKASSYNLIPTNYMDDDEDCMIIDDIPSDPFLPATSLLISSGSIPSPTPLISPASVLCPTSTIVSTPTTVSSAPIQQVNQDKINYTISYGGENSSLVVIQNKCDHVPTTMPDVIQNKFTILTTSEQSPSAAVSEMTECNISTNKPKPQQPIPINTIFNISSEDCRPLNLKSINDNIQPGEIILTFPTNDANTNLSIPAEHLSNFSITPMLTNINEPKQTESPISKINQMVLQSENDKEAVESTTSKFNEASMKLNKNITIKKITPSSAPLAYSNKSSPATAQKNLVMNTSFGPRFVIAKQKQPIMNSKPIKVDQIIQQIQAKPRVPQHASQIIRQTNQQTDHQKSHQALQRPLPQRIQPNFSQHAHSALMVRTPSTINTIIRDQQQNLIRNPVSNDSLVMPALNSVISGARLRTPTTNQFVRLQSNSSKNVSTTVISKSTVTAGPISSSPQMFKKILPDSVQAQQKDVIKRMLTTNQNVSLLQNQAKREINIAKPLNPSDTSKRSPTDPLHILERSTKPVNNNLPQTKQSLGIKTVHEIANQNRIQGHVISPANSVNIVGGIKRNSLGTPINHTQFRIKPGQKLSPKMISTVDRGDLSVVQQTSHVKGIPIELPKLKKFAIISSPTQCATVHTNCATTPPSVTVRKNELESSANFLPAASCSSTTSSSSGVSILSTATAHSSTNPITNKIITSNTIDSPTTITTTVSSTTKANPPGSSNANAEYGYFHANIDGLPKFVVKRVGEDFLIKVPNFNGILKLTGLSTVHNYLNQYTTQKCGKTNEEIENLKWTLKTQDRSKLNNLNRSSSPNIKSGCDNQNIQKLFSIKKNSTEESSPSSTSSVSTKNKLKLIAQSKPLETNVSIDLSDDE